MSIGVFAGTFDPFTVGHLDVVRRASRLFDRLVVAICKNPGKSGEMFTLSERRRLIEDAVAALDNVEVAEFDGVLVHYCERIGASCLIRSIRSAQDVDYERMLESVNRTVGKGIETTYLLSRPELSHISSTLVRQLIELGAGYEGMLPDPAHGVIIQKINGRKD